MRGSIFLEVTERSQVGAARRHASGLADEAGFDDAAVGRLAVVVTELATNLVSHAGGGEIFARRSSEGERDAVEVLAIDRGPGIADVHRALEDGFSTGSSAGTGLGAVARMADGFHIRSIPGEGTVVVAVVDREASIGEDPAPSTFGALVRPHPREEVAGDAWSARREDGWTAVAVVDGLGHGPGAREASVEAVRSFDESPWEGTRCAVERMHRAIGHTRGAVGGVMELDGTDRVVRFTGVGNITACLLGPGTKRSMVSMNGTLGLQTRRIREYQYPCSEGCVAVLHTDGISARWGSDQVVDLLGRAPTLLCAALYLRHYRGSDDATVVALSLDRLLARGAAGEGA